jgi:surface polysaccharide O-acyltransferase-like enzyme
VGFGLHLFDRVLGWVCILALIGFGKAPSQTARAAAAYLSRACFLFTVHQSVLVAVAFFATKHLASPAAQFFSITVSSAVLTFAAYELIRRIPYVRFLFGIKA